MRRCIVVLVSLVLTLGFVGAGPAAARPSPLDIEVLSNRADLISGGDALVRVTVPRRGDPTAVRVDVDGRDVTAAFRAQPDGSLVGLVEGLAVGRNVLTARHRFGSVRITLTNHPIGGPIFAGPQVQPWICGTERAGLGPATDAQCNAPTRFSLFYKSSMTGQFAAYDPAAPPPAAQIASTTTDQGVTVPYIVRVERGTADRGIHDIAVLFDPATAQPRAWNHKLVVPFGGGGSSNHTQQPPLPVLDDMALSRGFMIATSGLHIMAFNINATVSAEALMMLKERITERYGRIRYTIGAGCSGGSIQQHLIAATYPGLLDGIQPNCSYADVWTTASEVLDCHLLVNYFTNVAPALWPDPAQRALVDGHKDATDCVAWDQSFSVVSDPSRAANCNLPAELVYHPQTNPTGVRCTIQDYQVAIWGRRAEDGFAKVPSGNVGVQYGLAALNAGKITPAQFVDLNAKIGSKDIDWKFQAQRAEPDPGAVRIAYRAGQVTDARQLAAVPIVDLRGYNETFEIHTSFHSHKLRAKLDRDNGGHANQIIWTFPLSPSILPPPDIALRSFLLIDRWLADIEADTSHKPLRAKVIANKPRDAVDACWIDGARVTDPARCARTYPHFGDARIAAGAPLTDDILRCQLRHPQRGDYAVAFTDAEWAALNAGFPSGVCDWRRPGVDQRPSIPWLTFADGPGGRPLGNPPRASRHG
ncbi:MAG TPA: DUF6351 family protein [Actinophytocola sp.]|uniref:DUF6351 family protein n=1 Tax=Actinophytocola sp. TaxID=1872138 RepID=UPI002DDD61CA|nr:DUF6351 family protein [Actinophytocola sp.]HEV2780066.1 DUF6351 family protein [Actinophytocola sp.]